VTTNLLVLDYVVDILVANSRSSESSRESETHFTRVHARTEC